MAGEFAVFTGNLLIDGTGVAEHYFFLAMQQRVRLRDIGDVAGSADDGVDQASAHIVFLVILH